MSTPPIAGAAASKLAIKETSSGGLRPYGDDVGAIVLDLGFHSCSVGYAGDGLPRQSFASVWGSSESKNGNMTNVLTNAPLEFLSRRERTVPRPLLHTFRKAENPVGGFLGEMCQDSRTRRHSLTTNNDPETETTNSSATNRATPSSSLQFDGLLRFNRPVLRAALKYIGSPLCLSESLKGLPVLVTEPSKSDKVLRSLAPELLFEESGVSASYIARKSVLSCFACGRSSGLAAELGPLGLTVSPVYEGYSLQRHVRHWSVGGALMDWMVAAHSELYDTHSGIFHPSLYPTYSLQGSSATSKLFSSTASNPSSRSQLLAQYGTSRPGSTKLVLPEEQLKLVSPSYLSFARRKLVEDVKMSVLRCSEKRVGSVSRNTKDVDFENDEGTIYELPDGSVLKFNSDACLGIAEFWMDPLSPDCHGTSLLKKHVSEEVLQMSSIGKFPGMTHALVQTAFEASVDVRKDLLANVIVAGGPSEIKGFMSRLAGDMATTKCFDLNRGGCGRTEQQQQRLVDLSHAGIKTRVSTTPLGIPPRFATWLGGSILASLSTFQQMWISKAEWEEHGNRILDIRCVL